MDKLKPYLTAFNEDIYFLRKCCWANDPRATENFCIGGMAALRIHGLSTRESSDLDIVIYKPLDVQLEYLKKHVTPDEHGSIPDDKPDSPRRSFKIVREGLTADFLMEYDEEIPRGLLMTRSFAGSTIVKVQRIDVILAAKRKYNREKDRADFEMLKKNFD